MMSTILKECTLFTNWTQDEMGMLATIINEKNLNVGQILFSEGSQANSLFVVKSGAIKIEKASGNQDEQVAQFGKDTYFGEMGMLGNDTPEPRSASATASENSVVIEIPYDALNKLMNQKPELGTKFYKAIATSLSIRIRKTTQDLASVKSLRLRHV